jgi:hypothetical protein
MALGFGMRARFFDVCGKMISILSLFAGSAAYLSFAGNDKFLANAMATVTAALASINIVVGFSRKCRDFEVLRSKTYSLLRKIEGKNHSENEIFEFKSEKLSIMAESPPSMAALDMIAWQRTAKSFGKSIGGTPKVPLWHRALCHVWSFSAYYIHPKASESNDELSSDTRLH